MLHREDGRRKKSIILYDVGGWFLIPLLFGVGIVGLAVDYLWNYLVLILSLRWLRFGLSTRRKHIYCIIATFLGLVIDWLYYRLTWGSLHFAGIEINPIFTHTGEQPVLEFITILMPMAVLMLVNYILAWLYLHMKPRQALVLGTIMGFFTAPWLITVYVIFFS